MIKTKMPMQQSVKSPALTQLRYGRDGRRGTARTRSSRGRRRAHCCTARSCARRPARSSTGRLTRPQLTRKVDKVAEVAHPFGRRQSRKSGPSSKAG